MASYKRRGRRAQLRRTAQAPGLLANQAAVAGGTPIGIDYVDLETEPASWPTVSLCMIVRDEEDNLADCLRSVGDLASQTIIVDTGSTDRTVEIARSFGAEVRHFTWVNDFAAARNESIRGATGEWIFWMDADDRIAPDQLRAIKALLASATQDVYVLRVSGPVRGGDSLSGTLHSRLFRNGMGLHFIGRLHERLEQIGGRPPTIGRAPITIQHIGYDAPAEVLAAKARRNREILLEALAEEPDSLVWRYHLGVCAYMLGDWEGVVAHMEPVIANPPSVLHVHSELPEAYWQLMASLMKVGKAERACEVTERALQLFPDRQQIWATAGACYLDCGRLEDAAAALEKAIALSATDIGLGTRRRPSDLHLMLSRTRLALGDHAGARAAYLDWAKAEGRRMEPVGADVVSEAQRLAAEGRTEELYELLGPLAAGDYEALGLLCRAASSQQSWARAADYRARMACLRTPGRGDWAELAALHMKAGHLLVAKRYCDLALAAGEPDAAVANLRGVIALGEGSAPEAVRWFVVALVADSGYAPAIGNLAAIGLSKFEALRGDGVARLQAGDFAAAAVRFAAMVRDAPGSAEAHKLLATALRRLGRDDEALLCWQAAVRLDNAGQAEANEGPIRVPQAV